MFNQAKSEKSKNKIINKILDMAFEAGSSSAHLGGALSSVDIVTVIYDYFLNINKNISDRNRFILSKGHACLVLYAALAVHNKIPENIIKTFEKDDSDLPGHPVKNLKYYIEFSTGSLGMGLSLGIGVAQSFKIKKEEDKKIFVLMGDGEINEGSVWEAFAYLAHHKLNNIIVIIDKNNLQQTGKNENILNLFKLREKLESFEFNVLDIDGHNLKKIFECINESKKSNKPTVIIANTKKGSGISFMENENKWHHSILSEEMYKLAKKEINNFEDR